jgi:hypothetical protein
MALSKETLDQLTAEFKSPQELQSAYSQMLQHMINRALEAEMQAYLGHKPVTRTRVRPGAPNTSRDHLRPLTRGLCFER